MIVLFTDFGLEGPYTGQMKAVLHQMVPGTLVIDLFADAPFGDPKASSYLVAAYAGLVPAQDDLSLRRRSWGGRGAAGVGPVRPAIGVVLPQPAGRRIAAIGANRSRPWKLAERRSGFQMMSQLRDCSVRRWISSNKRFPGPTYQRLPASTISDLAEIVYIDHYGNAMTALRAAALNARLAVGGRVLQSARTFGEVPPRVSFWYENSNGLVEIAVNQDAPTADLELRIGNPIKNAP